MLEAAQDNIVPPEHHEVYSEICDQFLTTVLRKFSAMQSVTIFRDLPVGLQFNAVLVGATVGALVPTMMLPDCNDEEVIAAMRQKMPLIVREARKYAIRAMKGG